MPPTTLIYLPSIKPYVPGSFFNTNFKWLVVYLYADVILDNYELQHNVMSKRSRL